MISQLEKSIIADSHLHELLKRVKTSITLKDVVTSSFALGLAIAVIIASDVLSDRGRLKRTHPHCPHCTAPLESKGLLPRQIKTLIGSIRWKRRAWRCPKGCKIGQITPLDEELNLQPNQRFSDDLKEVSCVLAIFLPFGIAVKILKTITGVDVSPGSIWNWVQTAGKEAANRLESELEDMEKGRLPDIEKIEPDISSLPLLIGGDGVMVPFRPQKGTPKGKTVWKEIKVGIAARLGYRITKAGKKVSALVRRRLVAVLGTIDDLKSRLWHTSVKEGILNAKTVVWLSDGGRGFWRLFRELFSERAHGVLDFYHAAQYLWKGCRSRFDGRTKKARQWFISARQRLKQGKAKNVLDEIKEWMTLKNMPDSKHKILNNLVAYLEDHSDHMNYERYKVLGLPIGSGMVESACKWLIQQRFKCVGMRWSTDGFNNLLHLRLAWVNGTYSQLFSSSP